VSDSLVKLKTLEKKKDDRIKWRHSQ